MQATDKKLSAPQGHKVLTEGQAHILYIEQVMEKDD